MPRAVLFDLNGVLVDDEPLHLRLLLRVLAEEGIVVPEAWAAEAFLGVDDRSCLAAAGEQAGRPVPPERIPRLVARKAAYYREAIVASGYPVVAGAAEALRALDAAGLVLGVVSGALRREVEGALEAAGVRPLLRVLVCAEDVARGKPDPEGYLLAISALAREPALAGRLIHPHEIVAVEDSPAGLAAAAAAGLRSLLVTSGGRTAGTADASIATVAELTHARLGALFGSSTLR
ncbi:MAG TPA: HAD family phosphatase [Thermoanaerobaculia bacterium]|nr:HAD family phosphatase [Thermoanaerobaculia bacterium]